MDLVMVESPPCLGCLTTTVYAYLERILAREGQGLAPLLGLRWSFGLPRSGQESLTEYSLPVNETPIEEVLCHRGGVRVQRHIGDADRSLLEFIAGGHTAIAAIDAYYLPFRPAYLRVHSSRTVLVRASPSPHEVIIEDDWAPYTTGLLDVRALANARFSSVPYEPEREPIFAGQPIRGEWFSLAVEWSPRRDDAWTLSTIAALHREMTRTVNNAMGSFGLTALHEFCRSLDATLNDVCSGDRNKARRRGASLLLRIELSSRLYFCSFLQGAARQLNDPILTYECRAYRRSLGHLQAAVDVLTKTLRNRRHEYDQFIRRQLHSARVAEERLAEALSSYTH